MILNGAGEKQPAMPNTPHENRGGQLRLPFVNLPGVLMNSTSRGTTLGSGMSRQRQNVGAVGHVMRAMVVMSP